MRHFKKTQFYLLCAASLLSASAWSAQVACTPVGAVPAGQTDGGRSFNKCYQVTYSGADQVLTIPANTYVSSKLWGAAGGMGYYSMRGGAGGFAQGDFVADGRPLTVVVGQGGGVKINASSLPDLTGYGGGGRNMGAYFANWGGGLSGIFYNGSPFGASYPQVNAATTPVLVAGGGGSGSGSAWATAGGSGGGLAGQNAIAVYTIERTESDCGNATRYRLPTAGSQTGGGIAGQDLEYSVNLAGDNGRQWWGGWGGRNLRDMPGGGESAGGGAGYYGGGGGSPSWSCDDSASAGGSGYISPTLVRAGTGQFAMSPNAYSRTQDRTWIAYTAPRSNDVHYIAGVAFSPATSSVRAGDGLVVVQYYEPTAAPSLTIQNVSNGGTGSFAFKGTANANGFKTDNSYVVNTTVPGVAVSGATVTLSAKNLLTEVQETLPADWAVVSASCVDANAAISGNPTSSFGTLVGNILQIPATHVRAYAELQCTFTNAKPLTTLTVRQLVLSPVPVNLKSPYTFNYQGTNGWTTQPLTNNGLNTLVASSVVLLTAKNTATTVSTSLPESRWFVSSFNCTDTNAAVTGNPAGNLVSVKSTSVTVPAANVRLGSALRCTLVLGHLTP